MGRLSLALLRVLGRSGTTVPGRVAMAFDPAFVQHQAKRIGGPVVIVSATNGKTTTAGLIRSAMEASWSVIGNSAGANMAGGVASALVTVDGGDQTAGLFEVDEFWLGDVGPDLMPDVVLLLNLFRDQLDRYGELDTIVERWHAAVAELSSQGCRFVACADDPGIAWVLRDVDPALVTWFGCVDETVDIGHLPHAADSDACRRCGATLHYKSVSLGHLGDWSCPECKLERPRLDVRLTRFEPQGARTSTVTIADSDGDVSFGISLPGLYNAYNATGAWAVSAALKCERSETSAAFSATSAAFGRGEQFSVNGHSAQMLLVKNPTGANEVVRALCAEAGPLTIQFILNDRIADGRDVSWIWDTDLEHLVPKLGRVVCSGTRADEAALRFKYAGVDPERITVVPDSWEGLLDASSEADDVWILPTYTAMLGLRSQLSSEGLVEKVV